MVALRLRYNNTYDAVSLLVYILAIYIWGVMIYPMGRDFTALSDAGAQLPFLAASLFRAEMALFGAWVPGYHLVNLALLYACTLCVYHFTNLTVRGLWWFGTLSACMFLANPVHSEAILNLSGVGDLVPCLAGLLALTAYAWQVRRPAPWKFALALVLLLFATVPYRANATLVLVIVLYEMLAARTGEHSFARLGTFFVAGAIGLAVHAGEIVASGVQIAERFTPLYFLFYPLGFLPKTVIAFHAHPALAWLAVAVVILILGLIYRKARRPVILFGLLAMAALRVGPIDRPIDWVTLIGGGQLLLANALFTVGLVALFFRIMDHPKWRISMVGTTTTIVIILFAMQFISVRRWNEAGHEVRRFQQQALEAHERGPIGVLPDYRAYYGAPMNLSDSIAHDSIFSTAVPAVSILPIQGERPGRRTLKVRTWGSDGGEIVVSGEIPKTPEGIFPNPAAFSLDEHAEVPVAALELDATIPVANATVQISDVTVDSMVIVVRSKGEALPETTLPNTASDGEEPI